MVESVNSFYRLALVALVLVVLTLEIFWFGRAVAAAGRRRRFFATSECSSYKKSSLTSGCVPAEVPAEFNDLRRRSSTPIDLLLLLCVEDKNQSAFAVAVV